MSLPHFDAATWINIILLSVMGISFLFMVLHGLHQGGEAICKVAFTSMVLIAIGGVSGLMVIVAQGSPKTLSVVTAVSCIAVGIIGAVYSEHVNPRVRYN